MNISTVARSVATLLAPTLLVVITAIPAAAQTCEPEWSPLGTGVNMSVNALSVYEGSLYVGGLLTNAGGVPDTLRIARWDGESWHALGSGLGGLVRTFAHLNGDLFVGGNFTSIQGGPAASRVARWDGEAWSPLGTSVLNGQVLALEVFNGELYAAGTFTTADGVTVNRVVKWDGTAWTSVGGGVDSSTYALAVFDDGTGPALYAGGYFDLAGGFSAPNIAKWDGEIWSDVGGGTNGGVLCLTVFDDGTGPALYAGGNFSSAGWTDATSIAKWDGQNWSRVGNLSGEFTSISVYTLHGFDDGSGNALYAGGTFTMANGEPANRIASWDGQTWSPLGSGMAASQVNAITNFDDGTGPAIYAAGGFEEAGGHTVNRVARWGCAAVPSCPADWNDDAEVNSGDISSFLTSWLASVQAPDLGADFNADGATNSGDISAFLTSWLTAVSEGC